MFPSRSAKVIVWAFLAGWLLILSSCQTSTDQKQSAPTNPKAPTAIRFNGTSYELLRHGKPYFIKGAGGINHLEELKTCGGNSIRIWDDIDADRILDEAQALDLTVMFGLWMQREVENFDYHDRTAVNRQYERIRKTVLKYRNHPALLFWCIGNEWSLSATNVNVFDEVNRLAQLIHQLDPNHPVSTAIIPDVRTISLASSRCPDVDILAINSYDVTKKLARQLINEGWTKPFIISEYGAPAFWETPISSWDAPDEPNSQQKTEYVRLIYQEYIVPPPPNCFGSYIFYWGHKQEETHTWFSLFDEHGNQTPMVGLMQELWSGKKPPNQAPAIDSLLIDHQQLTRQTFSIDSSWHQAAIHVHDPEGDSLTYAWTIRQRARPEEFLSRPPITGLLNQSNGRAVQFRLPRRPGAYRLFVNVYDTHGHVATANFSFRITY